MFHSAAEHPGSSKTPHNHSLLKTKKAPPRRSSLKKQPMAALQTPNLRSGANHADKLTVLRAFNFELNNAFSSGEQGMILADANIATRMETCSTLTNQDIPSQNFLTTETLDTKAFRLGIATVISTTASFFMSHYYSPSTTGTRLRADSGNLNFGKPLTVTHLLHVVLTTLELDNANFLATTVSQNLNTYLGTCDKRGSDFDVVTVNNQQNLIQVYRCALFNSQLFYFQSVAFTYTVLLTTAYNYCVHVFLQLRVSSGY
tara:strand:- start:6710 stop:7486 length:777 start_codon:yes stop_codon:yes gene_type:complete